MSVVIICASCGSPYEAARRSRYGNCKKCAQAIARQKRAEWRERQTQIAVPLQVAVDRKVSRLAMVNDPLEGGAFRPGAIFEREAWTRMLKNLTFTPGTILKDSLGRLYEFRLGKKAGTR